MSNVTSTPEGGALETLASDKKVDVCQESGSSGSQLLMETSSLQIFEEVPLHQDASGAEVALNLLNPLSVGIQSAQSKMSDTVQKSERLAHDQTKGEVERVRTLEGSRENERVGVQPHCEGETRDLTLNVDDVLITGSLLPEVVIVSTTDQGL